MKKYNNNMKNNAWYKKCMNLTMNDSIEKRYELYEIILKIFSLNSIPNMTIQYYLKYGNKSII